MKVSKFGRKILQKSGIGVLMEDLGSAYSGMENVIMLGGGNPAHIPAVQEYFRKSTEDLLASEGRFERAIGNYDPPEGNRAFIEAMAELLNSEFGWDISEKNIALTNGSQSAFFMLFNIFGGHFEGGVNRKIMFPLAPEYIGYCDVGISEGLFRANKPEITFLEDRIFKYQVDFDSLEIADDVGAICVSRPTNPTGNVLSDAEMHGLSELAADKGIPFIIDNAYGTPFPNIIFTEARPLFNENTIVCMSLSKLGLPMVRTGIVIAGEEIIQMISQFNAVMCLAPNGLGASITTELVKTGKIIEISREIIRPFYETKAGRTAEMLKEELDGVDFYIHKPEGALFLWIWFRGLPISCEELYQRLKKRGVFIVPGHYFYPGLDEEWKHKHECIRLNYAINEAAVASGIRIIAEEVKKAGK